MNHVIVIGAGVAGLTAARALALAGLRVTVLERARGVGGRCATRRVDDQPVDHGVPFLHGRDHRFLAELESMHAARTLTAWPLRIRGSGTPCQPRAFATDESRFALPAGISGFAKHIASGLDVALSTPVSGIERAGGGLDVHTPGTSLQADVVALAMPIPQARPLFQALQPASPQLAASLPLLQLPQTVSCLAVIARYDARVADAEWDAWYPAKSDVLQAVFVDSSKRRPGARSTLVLHARPAFSRTRIDQDPEAWSTEMLIEAGSILGSGASKPTSMQPHRWAHARVQSATELTAPLLFEVAGGGWLGLCGDAFHASGGVEGAYLSGLHLASRILATAATKGKSHHASVDG